MTVASPESVSIPSKMYGYIFRGDNLVKMFLPPLEKGSTPWKKILSFIKVDPFSRRDLVCRRANRKSQNLSPLYKVYLIPVTLSDL